MLRGLQQRSLCLNLFGFILFDGHGFDWSMRGGDIIDLVGLRVHILFDVSITISNMRIRNSARPSRDSGLLSVASVF